LRRWLINGLRLSISAALLALLAHHLSRSDPETFRRLDSEPIDWRRMVAGGLLLVGEIFAGALRWWLGMKAAGLDQPFGRTLRTSLLAHALNFAALGVVGGDTAKALLISRQRRSERWLTIATVLIDRIGGMLCLAITVSAALALAGVDSFDRRLQPLLWATIATTLVATASAPLLLTEPAREVLARLPLPKFVRTRLPAIAGVVLRYRSRARLVAATVATGFGVVALQIGGIYLIGTALPGPAPRLVEQAVIVPLAIFSSIVPLPASALGVLDLAISMLYPLVTAGRVPPGQALLTVMASRIVAASVAAFGFSLYLTHRQQVQRAVREYDAANSAAGRGGL